MAPSPTRIGPEDLGARADHHAAAERGMALALVPRRAAERDAVIERAIVADLGRFADDDAHAVVDEHPPADGGARVDLDAGRRSGSSARASAAASASRARHSRLATARCQTQRVQARIAGEHFPASSGPRGRGRTRRRCLRAGDRAWRRFYLFRLIHSTIGPPGRSARSSASARPRAIRQPDAGRAKHDEVDRGDERQRAAAMPIQRPPYTVRIDQGRYASDQSISAARTGPSGSSDEREQRQHQERVVVRAEHEVRRIARRAPRVRRLRPRYASCISAANTRQQRDRGVRTIAQHAVDELLRLLLARQRVVRGDARPQRREPSRGRSRRR